MIALQSTMMKIVYMQVNDVFTYMVIIQRQNLGLVRDRHKFSVVKKSNDVRLILVFVFDPNILGNNRNCFAQN